MKLAALLFNAATSFSIGISAAPGLAVQRRAITQTLFDEFYRAAKLSQAAYLDNCASPGGSTRLYTIRDNTYDTDGYISKDTSKKQIIVALRGTRGEADITIDSRQTLVACTFPGSSSSSGCQIHQGFQQQWNAVASNVISQVECALASNSGYKIVVAGHSLGGALTTIAAVTLEKRFPGLVTAYSLASPRVGNPTFARFVERTFSNGHIYRLTHTDDSVPQDITQDEGYRHFGPEYWMSADPATRNNIIACNGGEDPDCNASVAKENQGFEGINAAHFIYMNINYQNDTASC